MGSAASRSAPRRGQRATLGLSAAAPRGSILGSSNADGSASGHGASAMTNRGALLVVLLLAFGQDAVFALIFLSYMNVYLLNSLHASPGLPGYTLALYGAIKLFVHPVAGKLIDTWSPRSMLTRPAFSGDSGGAPERPGGAGSSSPPLTCSVGPPSRPRRA